jgi:hypothetical protein
MTYNCVGFPPQKASSPGGAPGWHPTHSALLWLLLCCRAAFSLAGGGGSLSTLHKAAHEQLEAALARSTSESLKGRWAE